MFFQVDFGIEKEIYCLKDSGVGCGTFIKLEFPLVCQDYHLLSIGETYIVASILTGEDESNQQTSKGFQFKSDAFPTLRIKLFNINNTVETLYYYD